MKKFLGFTLSELMIAMLVMGILLAVVMPTMTKKTANKNKMFVKKAYFATSEVIAELINDDTIYATADGICPATGESGYVGFDCLQANVLPNNKYYGKLAYHFADKLNTYEEVELGDTYSGLNSDDACVEYDLDTFCYTFTTTDGIHWMFPGAEEYAGFPKGNVSTPYTILVDVNGLDNGDNCYEGSGYSDCDEKTDSFDQFRISIYADGRIEIPEEETWARDAIQISSSLTGK